MRLQVTAGALAALVLLMSCGSDSRPNDGTGGTGGDSGAVCLSGGNMVVKVQVSSAPVDCVPGDTGKLHELIFSEPGGTETVVPQSLTDKAELGGQSWTVKNVRSFEYGGYDGLPPFAWWATSVLK